jgi:hypothetical protein
MDRIAQNQGDAPRLGLGRPTFGMTRDQGKRIEVSLAFKNGGSIVAVEELDESLSADVVADYAKQLQKDIAEARPRTFSDAWSATGQFVWVDLGEVVAFSLRPSK